MARISINTALGGFSLVPQSFSVSASESTAITAERLSLLNPQTSRKRSLAVATVAALE